MALRGISAADWVVLPKADSLALLALAGDLEQANATAIASLSTASKPAAATQAKKAAKGAVHTKTTTPALPEIVTSAFSDMLAARDALKAALGPAAGATGGAGVKEADAEEDLVFGAAIDILKGLARLAWRLREGDAAASLLGRFGGPSKAFIHYDVAREWAAADVRLQGIAGPEAQEEIRILGLGGVVALLATTHAAYGAVVHGKAGAPVAPTPVVRAARETLADAIREYVFRCAGIATPKNQASIDLTNTLLLPYQKATSPEGAAKAVAAAPGGTTTPPDATDEKKKSSKP